jgi:hypothetical protein
MNRLIGEPATFFRPLLVRFFPVHRWSWDRFKHIEFKYLVVLYFLFNMKARNIGMKLSITLPSLFPDLLAQALESIRRNTVNVDYEVIVVSPFPVAGADVIWAPETEARGNCPAHAAALSQATGDIVLAMCDDMRPQPGWADRLLAFFLERERGAFPYACGLNVDGWPVGSVYGLYYPYFPVLRPASIKRAGGYFDPGFHAHFGDCDLGLRIWQAGGRCEFCRDARLSPLRTPIDEHAEAPTKHSARAVDLARFTRRWRSTYGVGWRDREIRDFNLNIPGRFFSDYIVDHTIQRNGDPGFRDGLLARYQTIPQVDFLRWD